MKLNNNQRIQGVNNVFLLIFKKRRPNSLQHESYDFCSDGGYLEDFWTIFFISKHVSALLYNIQPHRRLSEQIIQENENFDIRPYVLSNNIS